MGETPTPAEIFVPCETCDLEVPTRLAHLHPTEGVYICDGCFRLMGETPTPLDDATAIAAEILQEEAWFNGLLRSLRDDLGDRNFAEAQRLRAVRLARAVQALPDPRPTEAEAREMLADVRLGLVGAVAPLRDLGCFRPADDEGER